MIVKVVIPDSIYARVYFARGEQGPQGPTGPTGSQGPSGIVNVDSPITNSGTSTAANIGINQALLSITPAQVTGTAVITTDPRLSDTRIPTDASVTDSKITGTGLSPNKITGTAVITTDSRLSDARTPLAHAASHGSAGSDPVTLAQSQITNLVSDLSAKAPKDSPVFTTKVTLPVTSGTFLGTNSLGEIYKVGSAPGLGYVPYTASVGGGIAWQNLATLVKTDAANTFTVGGHLIDTGAAATKGLTIKRVAGQTANMLEFQLQDGTVLSRVDSSGDIYAGLIRSNYQLMSFSGGAAIVPMMVRGAASQSGDLQQWQNSAGTILSLVNSAGSFRVASIGAVASGNAALTPGGDTNGFLLATVNAGNKGLVVRGAASQSANLQEWQNSAGTVQALINPFGAAAFGTSSVLGRVSVSTGSTGTIGAVIRGVSGQTANLQEWQDSAGTILARIDSNGNLRANIVQTLGAGADLREGSGGGGLATLIKMGSLPANPGANAGRLYFRDGTNAGTLKLVVRAGAAGAETTILDNIPQ
jgi:hypothetical protein